MEKRSVLTKYLLLICTLSLCLTSAIAQEWNQWHFYVDAAVLPQADDTYEAIYIDFTYLMASDLKQQGTFDENSLRVAQFQEDKTLSSVPFRFIKVADYNTSTNAAGTLIFPVAGKPEAATVSYRVFFDVMQNGPKPIISSETAIPETANVVWNGGFEILSDGYSGNNRYANTGKNLPRGWWGNLRNSKIPENIATSAHSGQHAVGFIAPSEEQSTSFSLAPAPPGIRIHPGQSYWASFWLKGEKLSSKYPVYLYIYWYGEDQQFLRRTSLSNLLDDRTDFDWTQYECNLTAPTDAHYGTIRIGTYSTTGILMVDDVEMRLAIPPSVLNAKRRSYISPLH